ncbi:MAG: PAS domain S-box protein [Burkholderiales bacterium]|nr:PAS domain S-box protein [Burkholderiales bacterium]
MPRLRQLGTQGLATAALALAYVLAARIGAAFPGLHDAVPAIWLASGLSLAALVLFGARLALGVFVGALAAAVWSGQPLGVAAALGAGATIEALVGAKLLASIEGFTCALRRARDVSLLVFVAAIGASSIGATAGTASLLLAGAGEAGAALGVWLAWWGEDAFGMLIAAPAVFGWVARPRPDRAAAGALAYGALIALVLLYGPRVLASAFGFHVGFPVVAFALAPIAVLPAIRFELREVATFNLAVAATCMLGAAMLGGPSMAFGPDPYAAAALYAVLAALGVLTLTLCALGAAARDDRLRIEESEARFRSLTRLAADWYWEMDEHLRFTSMTEKVEQPSGVMPDPAVGRRPWEVQGLAPVSGGWEAHQADLAARRPFRDLQLKRVLLDGSARHVLVSGEPVLDHAGEFRGYRGVGRDVTAEQRAEQALRDSEQLFAHLFHSSPQAMVLSRLSGLVLIEVNAAWCELSGLSRDQALGRTVAELDLLENPEARETIRRGLESDGAVRDVQLRVRRPGGGAADVLYSGAVVELRGVKCVVGSLIDVSERNRTERELRESRRRLEAMFRGSPQPLAISTWEEGRILAVNDAWVRTFGFAREDVRGRSFAEIGLWSDPDSRKRVDDAMQATGLVRDFECTWRKANGESVDVLFFGQRVEFGGETVVLSTGMDVTERKRAERLLTESEQRFSKIFHASPVPVVISEPADGRYIEVNQAWVGFFGYAREEVLGRTPVEIGIWLTPEDRADFTARLAAGGTAHNLEYRMRKRSGEIADVLVSSDAIDLAGERRLLTSAMDITALKRAERQLKMSERRFRDFAEAAGEYVWETDVKGRFSYLSRRAEQVLGYPPEELYGRKATDLMPPGEAERVGGLVAELAAQSQPFRNIEFGVFARSGSLVWQLVSGVPILDETGRARGYRGTALDITERKRAEHRIEELATRDPLTGLPNRLLLGDRLAQGLLSAQREGELLAVLFIDLDHFKNINDTFGHQVGDLLLKEVARRLGGVVRKGDTLSRLGGDEFVIVLEGLKSPDDAGQVAQKILNALAAPCVLDGHTVNTAGSVGIAIYPTDGADAATLMRHADTAMYAAKSGGRKNYQFFSSDMNVRATERLKLEEALRGALERGELRVFYQPRVDIVSGRLTGAEALLRWAHPEHGLVGPARFMRVVEETGMIHVFGEWVLQTACNQTKAWNALHGPPFAVAVNFSAKQFNQALLGRVTEALQSSGLEPELLEIEVTERALTRNVEESRSITGKLRELGVRIVVDDFGTGYSSMSELRRLGVHAIKIDRSFIRLMGTSQDDRIVVRAIIDMARSLQLETIAEGVEREAELHLLRDMGCGEYLGNLLLPPVPASEFERTMLRTASIFAFPRRG